MLTLSRQDSLTEVSSGETCRALYSDVLHVKVTYTSDRHVPLEANGLASCLWLGQPSEWLVGLELVC